MYFVRFVAPNAQMAAQSPGLLSRLFGSSKPADATPARYRISVQAQNGATRISVLNAEGRAETNATAEQILRVLADDLK